MPARREALRVRGTGEIVEEKDKGAIGFRHVEFKYHNQVPK